MTLPRQQRRAIILIVAVGALAGAALWWGMGARQAAHAESEAAPTAEQAEHTGHAEEASHAETIAMTAEAVTNAAIGVETAGAADLRTEVVLPGEIRLNEDRTAHVVPRVAGVAEQVAVELGQPVTRGQLLAVLSSPALSDQRSELQAAQQRLALAQQTHAREKRLWEQGIAAEQDYQQARTALQEARIAADNARQKLTAIGAAPAGPALNRFELRAPFDGVVVARHLSQGEAVQAETAVFTIADLRTVWADFSVTAKDLEAVATQATATVRATATGTAVQGKVSYVGALLGEQTRSAPARVTLDNPKRAWRPGMFVNVAVEAGRVPVPVAVRADAVQTVDEKPSVFVPVPAGFEVRPVKTGRSDGTWTEILDGLSAGTRYAAANSYVLKAEAGKSADHGH
ncbi:MULTISPECIES: efflux RND transporter periplasmic adaptor subunit [Ralstonia solanacearum species complex]|uniref:efflux RND transporter periplasmic adaptor subunit n=1 Tax=Ralstonia solanacearum species complex TaxID=3116862 RepID=UPI000E5719D9|nr:efflux RND transporter periplasmic adaptor subunit [Ralstonia solanacearum]AXV78960.1 efflux transporter periplasmic adaptor subunit [Ralstonia solanacearum]AXV92979.1 efflux transporter periplasmic adaptor subunit [Ralstonia solanacearum]AXW21043.1 efflux transporter periplasmic adaptor subunit [Ralstonia solanacearum]AXW77876.1 efflux transporter periplasmic adaptor subunit [Ralstonia solanacearum]